MRLNWAWDLSQLFIRNSTRAEDSCTEAILAKAGGTIRLMGWSLVAVVVVVVDFWRLAFEVFRNTSLFSLLHGDWQTDEELEVEMYEVLLLVVGVWWRMNFV